METSDDVGEASDVAPEGSEGGDSNSPNSDEVQTAPEGKKEAAGGDKTEAAPPAPKRRVKVKVDGKEEEVDEDEVIREYQKGKAGAKRLQEVAEEKKKLKSERDQFLQAISEVKTKEGLKKVLKHLGADPKNLAKEILEEYVAEVTMTPEQRELADAKRKAAEYDAWLKTQETQKAEAAYQAEVEQYKEQFGAMVSEVLNAFGHVDPKTAPELARRAAFIIEAHVDQDMDLSAEDLATILEEELNLSHQNVYKSVPKEKLPKVWGTFLKEAGDKLSGQEIYELWGEEVYKKVGQYVSDKLKGTTPVRTKGGQVAQAPDAPLKFKSYTERKAYLAKLEALATQEEIAKGDDY